MRNNHLSYGALICERVELSHAIAHLLHFPYPNIVEPCQFGLIKLIFAAWLQKKEKKFKLRNLRNKIIALIN